MNRNELLNIILKIVEKLEENSQAESIFLTPTPTFTVNSEFAIRTILEKFNITDEEFVEYREIVERKK